MSGKSRLITAELSQRAELELKHINKASRAAIRLRSIISAGKYGIGTVAKVFGVTTNTLRSWIYSFKNGNSTDLEIKPGRGRKSSVAAIHQEKIKAWIKEDCTLTIDKLRVKLREEISLTISRSSVHRMLKKLDLSYITPRPVHHKQSKNEWEEFKKKSQESNRQFA